MQRDNSVMEETSITKKEIEKVKREMKYTIFSCVFIALILIFLFTHKQFINWEYPIDDDLFSAFGDIIGGVAGTIVGLFSAYLLVRTFLNQAIVNENVAATNNDIVDTNKSIVSANNSAILANKSAIEANNSAKAASELQAYQTQLQVFDNKFRSFMDAYQTSIASYKYDGLNGREAFIRLMARFINSDFDNHNDYKRRSQSAVEEYKDFYAHSRTEMSVHLRMLYLLVKLISESGLETEDMVMYAKLVRGQLCDAEMLLLRYNCISLYGQKMRTYCNQFNLIKHLPVTCLLEFAGYRKYLASKAQAENEDIDGLLSALDSMFIVLRKVASSMLYQDGALTESYSTPKRYSIKMTIDDSHTRFDVEITKRKTVQRRGGGIRKGSAERALDLLEEDMLCDLFREFYTELFFFSNFGEYNAESNGVSVINKISNKDIYKCTLSVSREEVLVLTQIQKDWRDNTKPIAADLN